MDDEIPVGARLQAWRKGRGISLRKLAVALGVSSPTLLDWEASRRKPTHPFREAIEVLTQSEIKATDWPISPREQREARIREHLSGLSAESLAAPDESGPLPTSAEPKAGNGTDG